MNTHAFPAADLPAVTTEQMREIDRIMMEDLGGLSRAALVGDRPAEDLAAPGGCFSSEKEWSMDALPSLDLGLDLPSGLC